MALFGIIKSKTRSAVAPVAFRDLGIRDALHTYSRGGAYAYRWKLKGEPEVGQWVMVPGMNGKATPAIIGDIGTDTDIQGFETKDVMRLIKPEEVAKAQGTTGGSGG